jgi:hypothetical protein
MVEAVIRPGHVLAAITILVAMAGPAACGHRLDEYLQSTLLVIEPGSVRLEMILTPGVAIAPQVMRLVDPDADGAISTNEAALYASMVKEEVTARLDGRQMLLKVDGFNFPEIAELETGDGMIQIQLSAPLRSLTSGTHVVSVTNAHLQAISVYLLNASKPGTNVIQIVSQRRSDNQSGGAVVFRYDPPRTGSALLACGICIGTIGIAVLMRRRMSDNRHG